MSVYVPPSAADSYRNKYKTNSGRNHYQYYAGTIIALYYILQL